MSAFNPWTTSRFKCDEPTRFDEADAKAKAEAQQEREVYAQVNARDKYRCRACGAATDPQAVGVLKRGHHHHIVYRSAGGATTTANVALVCARCHNDEHRHRIRIEGDADVALTIYNRLSRQAGWYISRQETAPHVLTARD